MDIVRVFQRATPLFSAIGDPIRQSIIMHLAERSYSVNELVQELDLSQPAVSHHLKILSSAGLVSVEKDGAKRLYAATPHDGLEVLKELIVAVETACPKGSA